MADEQRAKQIWEKLKKQKQKTQIHFILLYFTIFIEFYSRTKLRSDNRLVDNNRTLTYKPVHKGVKSFFWSLLGHILLKNELQNIDTRYKILPINTGFKVSAEQAATRCA